jgi:hypothetical protein
MTTDAPDDRLISGAVIMGDFWFEVGATTMATTYGFSTGTVSPVTLHADLAIMGDKKLESPAGSLSRLGGALHLAPGRESKGKAGRLVREPPDHYAVNLHMYEREAAQVLQLLAGGFRIARVHVEFDIEVTQGFAAMQDDYWDDLRYPRVDIHEFSLDWIRGESERLPNRHSMFGIKRREV